MRPWGRTFGQLDAQQVRCRRPQPGDPWHLDAVFRKIHGQLPYWGRAVAPYGTLLARLVPSRRAAHAAQPVLRHLLTGGQPVPRGSITDTLARYGVAQREILPGGAPRPQQR
jgi:transposase-like protein